jgi:hypothetical protein
MAGILMSEGLRRAASTNFIVDAMGVALVVPSGVILL